jgi:hypothetical protein
MLPALTSGDLWKLFATSCLSFLLTLSLAKAGCFTLMSPVKQTLLKFDSQPSGSRQPSHWNEHVSGEWKRSEAGLTLEPDQHGEFTISLQNEEQGGLIVLLFGQGPALQLVVSVSEDGTVFRPVQQFTSLKEQIRLDLSADTRHLSNIWLRIAASNKTSSGRDSDALLSRIRLFVVLPDQSLINVPAFALAALIAPLAYFIWHSHKRQGALVFSVLIQSGVLLLVWASATQESVNFGPSWDFDSVFHIPNLYLEIAYTVLIGIMAWQIRRSPDAHNWRLTCEGLALFGLLCLGAMVRIDALLLTSWDSLLPDALDYKQLAESLQSPFETGAREPLWVWMIASWFQLTEPSGLSLRLFSLLMSIVLLITTYWFIRAYLQQPTLAFVVTGLMAFNPFLVHVSVEGLRDEIFAAAVISTLYLVLVTSSRRSFPLQVAGLSLASAATLLLRFNSYLFLLPLLAFWAWRQEGKRKLAVIIPLLSLALVAIPVLEHNAREFGDPMHLVNVHARWARNQELVVMKQAGCDGCPSPEEFALNGYGGPAITATEYFFGLHGWKELMKRTANGYLQLYFLPTDAFAAQTGTKMMVGYLVYILGFCLLMLSKGRALLGIIVLIANVVPFLISIGLNVRLLTHTIPFATLILGYGIWWPCHRLFLALNPSRIESSVPAGTTAPAQLLTR